MQMFKSVSRVLAAAVSSACLVAPVPSLAWTFTVNGASCQSPTADSAGNITINCVSGTDQSAPIVVPPPPPPAPSPLPPVSGSVSCASIPGITGKTQVVPMAWQIVSGIVSTNKAGGFNANDAFVFTITPPPGTTTKGQLANFSISPSDSSAYNNRLIAISDTPCDFSGKLGPASVKMGQEPNVYFTVGGYPVDKYGRPNTSNANLTAGQPYYVTVIQQSSVGGGGTCSGTCNVNFGLSGL